MKPKRRRLASIEAAIVELGEPDPTPQAAYDLWLEYGIGNCYFRDENAVDPVFEIIEPMPPIRCVVEPPCGSCWYCDQAEPKLNPLVER